MTSGIVTEVTGAFYSVVADDGVVFRCRTNKSTKTDNDDESLVAVGDRVTLKVMESGTEQREAVITAVHERHSVLTRKRDVRRNRSKEKVQVLVSNIDQLVVVASAFDPLLNRRLIDRYLVFAESEQLPCLIVVNKMDLDEDDDIPALMMPYQQLGYTVLFTSVEAKSGLDELQHHLADKRSAFSGHSGVGKSALINALVGEDRLRTGDINMKTGKGLHTTTNAVMQPLPSGGFLIDTPGIREFNLSDITRDNLRFYFREFLPLMSECAYSSCTHTVEPDCAVRHAAESDSIDPERYESYLALYDSIEES